MAIIMKTKYSSFGLLALLGSFQTIVYSAINVHQDAILKKQGFACGTVQHQPYAKARVMNGLETSTRDNPWLAQVHLRTQNMITGRVVSSGGVVVSSRIILTCGRCVCDAHYGPHEHPTNCLPGTLVNQNRQGLNEVYYTIGTKELNPVYDENIWALLYKYEPEVPQQDFFSLNGDIAVLWHQGTTGLGLFGAGAVPICLPERGFGTEPFGDLIRDDRKVKLAGRGERRYDSDPSSDTKSSSCYTNEGVSLNAYGVGMLHFVPGIRDKFLPCEKIPLSDEYCYKISPKIRSFAPDSTPVYKKFPPPRIKKIERSTKDKCEKIWDLIMNEPFENLEGLGGWTVRDNADRIEVYVGVYVGARPPTYVCYNTRIIGKYGICKTEPGSRNQEKPVNYGFCSRSCSVSAKMNPKVRGEHDMYEEIGAIYWDTPPPGATDFTDSK